MPNDKTDYTPPIDDNKLGLTDAQDINRAETEGIAEAELLLTTFAIDLDITVSLILDLHRVAFGSLYDWAGKWRNISVKVGNHVPPEPQQIPFLMYQFADEVRFRYGILKSKEDLVSLLAYVHHRFVWIHPFNNGNGRTARMFTNLIALSKGFKAFQLYYREGEDRKRYVEALKAADKGDMTLLVELINAEFDAF